MPASTINIVELQSTGSTNDHAKKLAKSGYPAGTVVWAHEQTAGRGRQGNNWTSMAGNLFMTMILRPEQAAVAVGQLSFVAALALAETVAELAPALKPQLKWPNDMLLGGKKAAGILLETEVKGVQPVDWVVIGIGLNIVAAPEGAVSLKDLGVEGADARQVLEKLSARLLSLYDIWQKKGFEPVRNAWLEYAVNVGNVINIRLPRETFSGTFIGIDERGALQVEMRDGTQRLIASGEVFI